MFMCTLKLDVETGQGHGGLLSGLQAAKVRRVQLIFEYRSFERWKSSDFLERLARPQNWKALSRMRAKLTLT